MYEMCKVILDVRADAVGRNSTYRSPKVYIPLRRGVCKDCDGMVECIEGHLGL